MRPIIAKPFKFLRLFLFVLAIHGSSVGEVNQLLIDEASRVVSTADQNFPTRLSKPNEQAASLGDLVKSLQKEISENPIYSELADRDLGFAALRIQILNQLQHVSFSFETDHPAYPHERVLAGPYPVQPTLKAIEKALDFFKIAFPNSELSVDRVAKDEAREADLLKAQNDFAREVTKDSFNLYKEMSDRLTQNINAPFNKELMPVIEYLQLKIRSDEGVVQLATHNLHIRQFRQIALDALAKVRAADAPYMDSIEAIERALEFYDIYYRAIDPDRSPVLYHSGRYLYYNHFLKACAPDHILLPTLASLGATDILRTRGVPIGFVGVNTDIMWVDGYYQTPFEFYIHDINHSRRMFQFFVELAKQENKSIHELAQVSDDFVKQTLMPLLSISRNMSEDEKNHRRLIKILLFEILHEDALPALRSVIEKAVLREAGTLTPFETIVDVNNVHYVMEPGATTLRYVYRKLAHDFYDMPGERVDNIVAPDYRTEANILKAAEHLFGALGLKVDLKKFTELVSTDEGLPGDFRATVERDNLRRLGETKPLVDTGRMLKLAITELVRNPNFGYEIDFRRPPAFRQFMPDNGILKVHLSVPILGGQSIDVVVGVSPERLGVNPSIGSVRQIRGAHRIVEIKSFGRISMETLRSELLSQFAGSDYLLTVQAHDPDANAIVAMANQLGIKTLMLANVNNSRGASDASPTYFAPLPDEQSLEEMWDGLVATEDFIEHLRIDLTQNPSPLLRKTWSEFVLRHRETRHRLETALISERNVRPATLDEISKGIGKDKTPVYISGAMLKSWALLSPAEQDQVRDTAHRLVDSLDPNTTYLITSGFDAGSEREFHHAAQLRGIDVVAAIAESTDPATVGSSMTRAVIVSNTWSGKSRPVLEHLQHNNGVAVFVAGGDVIEEEIRMAQDMGVRHVLMSGPSGAANESAKRAPHRAFANADEAMALLYQSNPKMIRPEYKRPARDALYSRVSRELQKQGVREVSYRELVAQAEGRQVVVIGGYVGLGYADYAKAREAVKAMMIKNGDGVLYVGVGTYQGIGLSNDWIPEIAAELGFKDIKTAGIVSRNAVSLGVARQDFVHFVDGEVQSWKNQSADGTFVDVRLVQDTGGRHVFFEGGQISGETAAQSLSRGLRVEVVTGEGVAPDPQALARQTALRPDLPASGLTAVIERFGNSPNLTVTNCSAGVLAAGQGQTTGN